ncbi:VOC family protein [soil metagenome]
MIKEMAFVATPVTDIQRARVFYEGVLGLRPTMEALGGQWVEYELGSSTYAIATADSEWKPSVDGASVAFEVDDFDQTIAELKSHGVTFKIEKMETPVCWVAVIADPDGNKLMIHKRKGG